jgi:hypothetical protein
VAQTADGGYIVAGRTFSFGAGLSDVWLIKTDSNGDIMWTRTYGDSERDGGRSVALTADGGYVITGYTGASYGDVWLIKTDASGETMWTRTYDRTTEGRSMAQTGDGGFIITGYTRSSDLGYDKVVLLIKTDADGRIAVAKAEPHATHKPAPATIARAVLYMPETEMTNAQYPMTLLDVAGRKAMDLHPGPNDVRHLAPGVYFVRPAGTVPASGIPRDSPFRAKVILTR